MDQIKKQTAEAAVQPDAAALAYLMPYAPEASTLTVVCDPAQYSASALARAVEDCNAHLLNLNVTAARSANGGLMVQIRFDHRNPAAVARSLERYGYDVQDVETRHDSPEMDRIRDRVNELIHYLEI